ncbi:MAG: response regulator [Anaerolineales bacterium]
MNKGRILVVEDDLDIANMLRIYFTGQGYEVTLAKEGQQALDLTRQELPNLIVLDIILPDMDGYQVCKQLRSGARTAHIPIIFLTQKDERSDRIAGLELGADDYITKPFDIEELRLRVQNAIVRSERESLTDPRTGLPAGRLIEDQLRSLLRRSGWALLDCQICEFDPYREVYGFLASDDVLRETAMMLNEILQEHGSDDDFLGHVGSEHFIAVTSADKGETIRELAKERFKAQVNSFYSKVDVERGHLLYDRHQQPDQEAQFMSLAIGLLHSEEADSASFDDLLEAVAERRRQDQTSSAGA